MTKTYGTVSSILCVLGSITFGFQVIPKERLITERAYKPGDYVLGGLFPVHYLVTEDRKLCVNFSAKGLSWVQAFLYAIESINNNTDLLPNVTLGYDIRDDCNQVDRAVEAAYDFISGRNFGSSNSEAGFVSNGDNQCLDGETKRLHSVVNSGSFQQHSCPDVKITRRPSVIAVVGSASSAISAMAANILGVENVPQISYASTSRWLSDKKRYRSFFRTISSDDLQVKVMVDLVNYFNWTYLSTLASGNMYGEMGIEAFEERIKKQKVCIAIREIFPHAGGLESIEKFVGKMKNTEIGQKSNVVLAFFPEHDARLLLEEINKHRLTGKILIAPESWADTLDTLHQSPEIVRGILGIVSHRGKLPLYEHFLEQLTFEKAITENIWLKQFFEMKNSCPFGANSPKPKPRCNSPNLNMSSVLFADGKGLNVIDAVNAVAHALHNLICHGRECDKNRIQPRDLLEKLREVNFIGSQGNVSFDRNGDKTLNNYVITNVQENGGLLQYVDVGNWDGTLNMEEEKIVWNDGTTRTASSACSEDCQAGYRILYGSSKCCWACVPCEEGSFSNSTNMETCIGCGQVHGLGWTNNTQRTGCVQLPVEYLTRQDNLAIAASVLSLCLFLGNIFSLAVFIKYRDTPVVKGSNRELTFLLLVFLSFCFLSPFIYIGMPGDVLCKIQPNYLGFVFTVCMAVMFTKTRRILTVFAARTAIVSDRKRAEQKQILLLLTITLIEGSIVGLATHLMPPMATFDYSRDSRVILDCGQPWLTIHLIAMSYCCLVAIVCTFLAFKARKLPEAFNEARSISFTMFMMILVWVGSIPAYLGSIGKARTAWFCFSTMLAALPMLLFLILPKVRIILFYPEKNRADVVRSQTTNHILTKTVGRTSEDSVHNDGSQSNQLRRRSNTAGSSDSDRSTIHPRQHAKAKRQISSTESQQSRFSDISERSGISPDSRPGANHASPNSRPGANHASPDSRPGANHGRETNLETIQAILDEDSNDTRL